MAGRRKPQTFADKGVKAATVPPGAGERFSGYGVMGMPFSSGHYLALRHMTASSIGPSYRAVWHRDPEGHWTVYADAPPEVSCARFLGSALTANYLSQIRLEWSGASSLTVQVPGVLSWHLDISADFATRMMSGIGARLPAGACHSTWLLRPMGVAAGSILSIGKVRLLGLMPNGQTFGAIPRRVWRIEQSRAEMHGASLGAPGPLLQQERLGDFLLPQRGIFFAEGATVFTPSTEGGRIGLKPQQATA